VLLPLLQLDLRPIAPRTPSAVPWYGTCAENRPFFNVGFRPFFIVGFRPFFIVGFHCGIQYEPVLKLDHVKPDRDHVLLHSIGL